MRIIHRVEVQLLVTGIYGWGKGYLHEYYPSRWASVCAVLHAKGPFKFRSSLFIEEHNGTSERFIGEDFHAYMHPMEVTASYMSSKYCPGDNAPGKFLTAVKADFYEVIEAIRSEFSELPLTFRLKAKDYKIDLDAPVDEVSESF